MQIMNAAQETAHDADQVESSALDNQNASIDEGLTDAAISGESEDAINNARDDFDSEEYARDDQYNDDQQGRILEELENRVGLLGNGYPFELKGMSLSCKATAQVQSNAYVALLKISLATRKQGTDWLKLVNCFENLSAIVIREFFQCRDMWWTGAGSPGPLKERIDEIHAETGELAWGPDPDFDSSRVKDAGLDFINYRNLVDDRKGGIFYFGQSACGNDWISKVQTDLRQSDYGQYFRAPYANPVKVLTIPHLITRDHANTMLRAMRRLSGLVFDRARLTRLICNMAENGEVKDKVSEISELAEKCN